MYINKTDSGFDALLVHGIGLINDRVNYQFHDFYMSFNPVDRGGKYYINIFDKNYVLRDIIITDKVVLVNTQSASHTMEQLFERMEKEAMRDLMNDETKPTFEGNKVKQDVKDHTKHFLQFPVLQDKISSIERKCRPQGITSDALRLDNIQRLPTPGMLGFLADFLNNGPSQTVTEKEEDKEDSLAKLYFMITGIDGEKHFKLIGSKNLKHEKQLPRAYTSGYPVMYLFGLHSEYLRLIDDNGVSHTFRIDESILDEGRLGWAVKTAKAAGDRLTLINRKIKKFNETLDGKIIEVEI